MKKISTIFMFLAISFFATDVFSSEFDKIKKGLNSLKKEVEKEIINSSQKKKTTNIKEKKQQEISKKTSQLDQLEALDQKISSLNQVKLIYCKVSATKEFLRDNRSNKKGDKVKLDYYIFDIEEDLKSCSNYKAPWSNSSISKLNIISSDLSNPKDAENYWANKTIKFYNSRNVKVPIGQKVSLKTANPTKPRLTITKELTFNKSDLIRYCIGGNSTSYKNRRSIQRVSVVIDTRDNKIITYKCRQPSGNTRDDLYEIVPVSKGIFSKNDIKNFTFETQTEIKNINTRIVKEKKEEKIAKAEAQRKKIEYDNSPEGILLSSYKYYILIKDFYEARKQYAVPYVTSKQFSTSKSQVKAIESQITKNNEINKNQVWDMASKWYKNEMASTMDLIKSTGVYTQEAAGNVKIYLMLLSSNYNKVVKGGATAPKKDF